jgi:hypothetical protein
MTETIAIITAAFAMFAAIIGAAIAVLRAIKEVHLLINSRMTELLELTRLTARREGVIEGEKKGSTVTSKAR